MANVAFCLPKNNTIRLFEYAWAQTEPSTAKIRTIRDLIEATRPSRIWQEPLRDMLRAYLIETDAHQVIMFMEHLLTEAKIRHQTRPNDLSCLVIDFSIAPRLLNRDLLNTILIALGFEIEEPDGYHPLEDMTLIPGPRILMPALDGMLLLLSLLKNLHWNLFRLVFILSREESAKFKAVVEASDTDLIDQKMAAALMSSYPDEMRQLGFQRVNKSICRNSRSFNAHTDLSLVLYGLFDEGYHDGAVDV